VTELRVRDPFKPTERQRDFFEACDDPDYDEILFDGSIRAGKTQACCKKVVAWAWTHGGRYVIARKTYRELRDSTQAVLLRGEGNLPPALPNQLLKGDSLDKAYKGQDEVVFLKNGAEIMFRSLENREDARAKLRNLSLNAIFIDQIEELEDDEDGELYEELLGRLSDPRGPRKMLLAANPGPIDHWVYRRFVDEDTKKPWCKRVHVTLFDNERHLESKYVEGRLRTEKTNPDYFKRFILGEWGSFGGKRFKVWDGDRHIVEPFQIPQHWEVFEGIDYGYQHPFCCLWLAVSPERRWYVFAEHYEADRALSYHAKRIREIRREQNVAPSVTWIDPSTTRMDRGFESVQLELTDLGIYTARAENERIGGWARLDEMLTVTLEDGKPWLQVFNTCKNLIREIPSAKLKEGTDDIDKRHDHALDALRYAVMSRPPVPIEPEEEDDDDMRERYVHDLHQRIEEGLREEMYVG
jgi:PBSX family phage terminase large subunit